MAKDFDSTVEALTSIRLKIRDVTAQIRTERNGLISNQYLLDDALNHNLDGSAYQRNITTHLGNIQQLTLNQSDLASSAGDLLIQLNDGNGDMTQQVGNLNDKFPILFFPVRIETAFPPDGTHELWVRVFPDEIEVDTHEEDLTDDEIAQGEAYWKAYVSAAGDQTQVLQAWDLVVKSFDARRAAWVVLQTTPANLGGVTDPEALVFPNLTAKPDSWTMQPYTEVLPDAFMIYAYAKDGTTVTHLTGNVPDILKMGIDPSAPDTQTFDQQTVNGLENELMVGDPDVLWMTDFDAAIGAGLGARLALTGTQYNLGFDKIVVLGVKTSLTLTESQNRLQQLIDNHHYTDGFALLKQGTPTNNTDTDYSGYTEKELTNDLSLATELKNALFTPVTVQQNKTDGQVLCEALGIDYDILYHIFQSNSMGVSNAMNYNVFSFQSAIGYWANELFPIFGDRNTNNTTLRDFFNRYVRGSGALPSIRSGSQPYGILPASVFSRMDWAGAPNEDLYTRFHKFGSAMDIHFTTALEAHPIGARLSDISNPSQVLSDILSKSPVSTGYIQRFSYGTGSIWNLLQYAGTEFPKLSDQWLSDQSANMRTLVDKSGLPIDTTFKGVQLNHLPQQATVTTPLVAEEKLWKDGPLPQVGSSGRNYLEVLAYASFDEMRDESYASSGLDERYAEELNNAMLYRFTRVSLMLEYYEAACDLLGIAPEDRSEKELVNIVEDTSRAAVGEMGPLSYGSSRLAVMAQPYAGFDTVAAYIDAVGETAETKSLAAAKKSMASLATATIHELDQLTANMLDTSAFRLDVWRLSLVDQRLNAIRGISDGSLNRNMGLYLGAYGWVTDVTRKSDLATEATPDGFSGTVYSESSNKGFIHAPSVAQAANGAVMLSGYTGRADATHTDPFSINLSSERVRTAREILDNIRGGQELGVLLGYELERRLHNNYDINLNFDAAILKLRQYYSLNNTILETTPSNVDAVKSRNVINGLTLLQEYKTSGDQTSWDHISSLLNNSSQARTIYDNELDWLSNLMDAISDIGHAEGMFQIVQGNPVKGGAILEAISKGSAIADPDVLDTGKTGTSVYQRFTMHFNVADPAPVNGWPDLTGHPMATAEAPVNKWLSEMLPSPDSIFCTVKIDGVLDSTPVTAADLGISPLQLMYQAPAQPANDDATLSLMIRRYVRQSRSLTKDNTVEIIYDVQQGGKFSFVEILPILLYARNLLGKSRNLNTKDYLTPTDATEEVNVYDISDFADRLDAARTALNTAIGNLQSAIAAPSFDFAAVGSALYALNAFGIEQTVYEYPLDSEAADQDTLALYATNALTLATGKYTQSIPSVPQPATGEDPDAYVAELINCFKTVFGQAFVPLPLFMVRAAEQAPLALMLSSSTNLLADNAANDLLLEQWVAGIAKVRENPANYQFTAMMAGAVDFYTFHHNRHLRALQLPYSGADERWLGAKVNSADALLDGRVAYGASVPAGHDITTYQAGIMVDEWLDVIPNAEETTGVAFHHDQPNAKAPQCLILGLSPQLTGSWQWNDLRDMINETMDLAKKRGLGYEDISDTPGAQILPWITLPATPDGNGIGFNPLSVNQITDLG